MIFKTDFGMSMTDPFGKNPLCCARVAGERIEKVSAMIDGGQSWSWREGGRVV